jgi:RimJ/RimL family protein N-acetyltransferase
MSQLVFRLIDKQGLSEYETWFADAELRRRIERPTRVWFDYVRQTPGCFSWLIYEDGIAVGQVQMDTYPDQTATLGLVVKPQLRRQGYGKRILSALLERDEVAQLYRLEATIEPNNTASLRCFESAGFRQQGAEPDAEGFLHFVYIPVVQ